jgi:hypothetical protein
LQDVRGAAGLQPRRQDSRTSDCSSLPSSDHRAVYNVPSSLDDCSDSLLMASRKEVVEQWSDLDRITFDAPSDTNDTNDTTLHTEIRCWRHGCNGKRFSSRSNLVRHQVELGKTRPTFTCPICNAIFSRTTARNQHVEKRRCNRIRRYSNGRERPRPRLLD